MTDDYDRRADKGGESLPADGLIVVPVEAYSAHVAALVHWCVAAVRAEETAISTPPLFQVLLQFPFEDRRAAVLAVFDFIFAGWSVVVNSGSDSGPVCHFSSLSSARLSAAIV